jgi:hypothetical protein
MVTPQQLVPLLLLLFLLVAMVGQQQPQVRGQAVVLPRLNCRQTPRSTCSWCR